MKKATQESAVAVTNVFWDINMCPVPEGYDPRLVRPSLERLLEKNGYHGPLTVTAFGKLADVPIDMLRGVFSSGINLLLVFNGTSDIWDIIDTDENPSPANFMVISDPKVCPDITGILLLTKYNPLQLFPYDSIETLLAEGAIVAETAVPVLWDCLVCCRDPPGRSFRTFEEHLSSEEHHELLLLESQYCPSEPPVPPVHNLTRPVKVPLLESKSGSCMIEDWDSLKSKGNTIVFWDINSCPVPPDYDASMVGPCIKLFLKKAGYSGPLSIIAVGVLTVVPYIFLSKVFSSGITLHNVPYGPSDILDFVYYISCQNGPPLNIM
ncbi:hypothetical protein CARUB_v10028314mg, partial [Capsella rubella]